MTIDISKDTLLGIDEICEKLSISRSTFERMRGSARPRGLGSVGGISSGRIKSFSLSGDEPVCNVPFPEPSCMIGRSPRWTVAAINGWLRQEASQR